MRVLVVEDEPDIAQFICPGFGESGYTVDLATDGLSGLDYLLATNYDLLVFLIGE